MILNYFFSSLLLFVFESNNCELNFENTGIRKFTSNTKIDDVKIGSSIVKSLDDKSVIIQFEDKIELNGTKSVIYNLVFKNNKLYNHSFTIKIDNYKEGSSCFIDFISKIDKNNNKFINGDKFAFMETNEKCKKYLRLEYIDINVYIHGGIIYLK